MSDNQTEKESEKVIGNLETVYTNPQVQGEVKKTLEEITKSITGLATPELKHAYASQMASKIRSIDPNSFDSTATEGRVTHFDIAGQIVSLEDILNPKEFKFQR